jgi:hypothetical protein
MAPGTRPRAGRWGWIQAQAGQADDSNGLVTWNQLRKRGRSPKRLLGRPRMRSEPLSRRVTQTGMGTARQRRWSELWTSTEGQLAVRALPNMGCVLWTADASPTPRRSAFALVSACVEPPAGIEPATPSLPWNHREPLCGPALSQVACDRRPPSNVLLGASATTAAHQDCAPVLILATDTAAI